MTMTRSQIERLGVRLVRSNPPAAEDLRLLHELLLAYGDALAEAVTTVRRGLAITPSARLKTTGTIIEKLERYGGSWLKSIQDLAGMRIVGTFDRRGQDALVAQLGVLFSDGSRPPKVIDRRAEPSYGYRAVHVVVFVRSLPVEIQVRTELQHEWADLFEKLADTVGRGIRYGEPPDRWLLVDGQGTVSPEDMAVREHLGRISRTLVDVARRLGTTIETYELVRLSAPEHPRLPEGRRKIDIALARFTTAVESLAKVDVRDDL